MNICHMMRKGGALHSGDLRLLQNECLAAVLGSFEPGKGIFKAASSHRIVAESGLKLRAVVGQIIDIYASSYEIACCQRICCQQMQQPLWNWVCDVARALLSRFLAAGVFAGVVRSSSQLVNNSGRYGSRMTPKLCRRNNLFDRTETIVYL